MAIFVYVISSVAVFTILGQKGVRDPTRAIVGVQLQVCKAGKRHFQKYNKCHKEF